MKGSFAAALYCMVVLAAGCATAGSKTREETLKARLDALESQVAALNQRVEEATPGPQGSEGPAGGQRARMAKASPAAKLSVRQIQRALTESGFYKGTVDGKEGPLTKKALKEFQQVQGLKPDGIVGPATTDALSRYLDPKQE